MRIFVAYVYNPRVEWIEQLVFPLVTAFDSTLEHGKDLQELLRDEVKKRTERCHGLVFALGGGGLRGVRGEPNHASTM